jgi:hypothetical protein
MLVAEDVSNYIHNTKKMFPADVSHVPEFLIPVFRYGKSHPYQIVDSAT